MAFLALIIESFATPNMDLTMKMVQLVIYGLYASK